MRRAICLLTVLLLCVTLACPVFATGAFVPSISDKDEPEIKPEGDVIGKVFDKETGEIIAHVYIDEACLVITPISKAETSTEIPEESRTILLDVYDKLMSGEMVLPYEKLGLDPDQMTIRDLIDATFLCEDMPQYVVDHPELLAPDGICLELTFDLGIGADTEVYVMTYNDGVWNPIVSAVNNGDGTVTCVFEHLCPIVFTVRSGSDTPPAQTGDPMGANLILWVVLMVASAATLIVVMSTRRKEAR